jgi:TP901 family phage tail tape measure protein
VSLNSSMGLGFVFTARDLASAKMQGVERRFASLDERVGLGTQRMTANFRQLGVGLAVFTAGLMVVAGSLSLANAAGKFEQGLAAVGAVTRATTREMDMLGQAAIEAGIRTQFSPTEAVEGLTSLATAGQTATQATRTLIPVLDLAAGSLGQLGVAAAAEAVVGTLNAYGMAAGRAAGVTDKLLRITQLTNFQTRDFQTGLAKAAASGATFNQTLDDTLITMGLLRNRNIDASSSATAFREAVRRVGADTRAQNAVIGAGVKIFDQSTGRMRSIVDVMSDFARATANMTDKERNRRVAVAFGARGLLAFNAIQKAAFTTIRDGTTVTLRGAEAIAALRKQMGNAAGTAAEFRDKLLDTFQGQKTLLKGTMQTFAVVLGQPFAKVFKPIVRALVNALNAILRAFQSIPAPIKKALAGVILTAGGFLALVGGIIAAKATIALLVIAFKALGLSIGGILASLLPVILIIGVLALVVAGFYIAFKKNLGGIGDFARQVWDKVSLFFRGLMQLFKQGGFSGAVREELNRAENLGLKRFLIAVWQIAYRIQQVWRGFTQGFTSTVEAARPVFEDLVDAFSELGREIGALFGEIAGGAAGLPSDKFLSFGQVVGTVLGTILKLAVKIIAVFARITAGIVGGFRSMLKTIRPALTSVASAIGMLRDAWNTLTGATKSSSEGANDSTAAWRSLGEFLGRTLGVAITGTAYALGAVIRVLALAVYGVKALKDAFVWLGTWSAKVASGIYVWYVETLPNAIRSAIQTVASFFRALNQFFLGIGSSFSNLFKTITAGIQTFIKPVVDAFNTISQGISKALDKLWDHVLNVIERIPDGLLPSSLSKLKRTRVSLNLGNATNSAVRAVSVPGPTSAGALTATPAATEAGSRNQSFERLETALRASTLGRSTALGGRQPIILKLQVDGETIARASYNADQDTADRTYSSVPAY